MGCARHERVLTGESPERRRYSTKRIAKDKGVRRETEYEGSWRQTTGLTNRNCIRHTRMGKSAKQDEAPSVTESEV